MTGVCPNGHESRIRSARGSRIAGHACPICGEPLHGKGKGAIKRGRCPIDNALTEFTVPDVGEPVYVYLSYQDAPNRTTGRPGHPEREAVPGEHLCLRHVLRVACDCDVALTRGTELGRISPPYLFSGVDPCPIHGGKGVGGREDVPPAGQP